MLYSNWKDIIKKAWSIRFIILAGLLSGAEVILPFFADSIPRGLFAVLTLLAVSGAFISRIVVQRDLDET
jgi:hypothetical protein